MSLGTQKPAGRAGRLRSRTSQPSQGLRPGLPPADLQGTVSHSEEHISNADHTSHKEMASWLVELSLHVVCFTPHSASLRDEHAGMKPPHPVSTEAYGEGGSAVNGDAHRVTGSRVWVPRHAFL